MCCVKLCEIGKAVTPLSRKFPLFTHRQNWAGLCKIAFKKKKKKQPMGLERSVLLEATAAAVTHRG